MQIGHTWENVRRKRGRRDDRLVKLALRRALHIGDRGAAILLLVRALRVTRMIVDIFPVDRHPLVWWCGTTNG